MKPVLLLEANAERHGSEAAEALADWGAMVVRQSRDTVIYFEKMHLVYVFSYETRQLPITERVTAIKARMGNVDASLCQICGR